MTKALEFFKLPTSFTKKDLDDAYTKKIKNIDQLNISDIDKEYYKQTAKELYFKASNYVTYENINNNNFNITSTFSSNNNQANIYSYQEVSSSRLNSDGSISVYKKSFKNNNGNIINNEENYTKHKDGKVEYHTISPKIKDSIK
jgi:hypothetical protein